MKVTSNKSIEWMKPGERSDEARARARGKPATGKYSKEGLLPQNPGGNSGDEKIFEVFAQVCENLGMAKLLCGKTRVTIEHTDYRETFEASVVQVSGDTHGKTFSVSVNGAVKVDTTSCAKIDGYTRDETPLTKPSQSQEELDMIKAAQERELVVLEAARMIAGANHEAERLIENADHKLNVAIQKFLHTGQGNVTASKVLEKGGIWASEDRTAAVACAELDKLYGVDTLQSGL